MTKKYKEWQDKYGYVHIQKNPNVDSSENGPTFTGEVEVLLAMNGKTRLAKAPRWDMLKESEVKFRDRAVGEPLHFSLDNMTGLYLSRELDHHDMELPICRWDTTKPGKYERKYWLHPRELILFSMLSGGLPSVIGYLLSPLLLLIAAVSFSSERGRTSGKMLWLSRFGCLSVSDNLYKRLFGKLGLVLGHAIMKSDHGDKPFLDAAEIYFQNEGHPIREELEEWYSSRG